MGRTPYVDEASPVVDFHRLVFALEPVAMINSSRSRKIPQRSRCSVSSRKKRSTMFNPDALVGVKYVQARMIKDGRRRIIAVTLRSGGCGEGAKAQQEKAATKKRSEDCCRTPPEFGFRRCPPKD